jgi:hypothetical protein
LLHSDICGRGAVRHLYLCSYRLGSARLFEHGGGGVCTLDSFSKSAVTNSTNPVAAEIT